MDISLKAKPGMEDVYNFLKAKKENLANEFAEKEKSLEQAILAVTEPIQELGNQEVSTEYETQENI